MMPLSVFQLSSLVLTTTTAFATNPTNNYERTELKPTTTKLSDNNNRGSPSSSSPPFISAFTNTGGRQTSSSAAASGFSLAQLQQQQRGVLRRERIHPLLLSPSSSASSSEIALSKTNNNNKKRKDYRKEAIGLFGQIRIPASLFAGAAGAAAFALPIAPGESMKFGIVKRIYYLLMITALSSEIIAVVVATLTGIELSIGTDNDDDNDNGNDNDNVDSKDNNNDKDDTTQPVGLRPSSSSSVSSFKTTSINELLYNEKYFQLEWVATVFHFLSGILCFGAGLGIRAWVSITCPIISRAALGIVASSIFLCVAFFHKNSARNNNSNKENKNALRLPFDYMKLLYSTSKKNPLFALALAIAVVTKGYIIWNIPHIMTPACHH